MAYRNKTYIAFDGDNDIHYCRLMKAWRQSDSNPFNFIDAHEINYSHDWAQTDSIKKQLRERMVNSKAFILLLGETTKKLTRFVEWEVEHAIFLELPIIVVNLNGKREIDTTRMPKWLDNYCYVCCSFNSKIIQFSLETWPQLHSIFMKNNKLVQTSWNGNIYASLGL